MNRKERTKQELQKAAEATGYEINMFYETAKILWSLPQEEKRGIIYYALVESFVIHMRVLIDLFYGDIASEKPMHKENIWAGDFYDSSDEWCKTRPEYSGFLKDSRDRAHKKAAHLSYQRLDDEEGWDVGKIFNELNNVIVKFKANEYMKKVYIGMVEHPKNDSLCSSGLAVENNNYGLVCIKSILNHDKSE